ncbi:hypothetical protein [Bacteroides sp.]|nr:hypothetical protein [Bacteroides sp.]MDD3038210.1 hypothetical protein [Bacteroides sp.]
MKGVTIRYVKVATLGVGVCSKGHVRPGQESKKYFDEVIIQSLIIVEW